MKGITIKRRKGQKHIRIRINRRKEVIVSAPLHISRGEIQRVIDEKTPWIEKTLSNLEQDLNRYDPLEGILYMGSYYPLEMEASGYRRGKVVLEGGVLTLLYDKQQGKNRSHIEEILSKWLQKQARSILPRRAEELAKRHRISINKIYIRNQRTRWGSSSTGGNLSFNWRVIMGTEEVQDYLIVHELCHQRHMNHSPAFWGEVERRFPHYRRAEAWLKEHRNLIGLFR